jgi:hypothetical protein
VGIFGRNTARQRLRRATRESLTIPTFSSAIDCTSWVIGGLWPAELSTITAETTAVAEHLKADLERIASGANDEVRTIRRAGMADSARQATEARVIDEARHRAVRRIESTVRQLHNIPRPKPTEDPRPCVAEGLRGTDLDTTQVLPIVTEVEPEEVEPEDDASVDGGRHRAGMGGGEDESAASDRGPEPEVVAVPAPDEEPVGATVEFDAWEPEPEPDVVAVPTPPVEAVEAIVESDATELEPEPDVVDVPTPQAEAVGATAETESDGDRLGRLLEFVARQEPRLHWAVADQEDGATVLATDLAHGWIPPGITLPDGVRLLEPAHRTGKASAWVGNTTHSATYAPGEPLDWSADSAATKSSMQPRELPAVEDLGWELSAATHWRDGLPRLVHTVAKAAAAGTGVVDEEIDLLRVHLDTARYRLLVDYPNVDAALLLNCLLLAATEGIVTDDSISANYHLAWFQKLNEHDPSVGLRTN